MKGLQNMQNPDRNLVLSSDAKPRLKWTPELHQRFVDAVNQIGGENKATPKSLMRAMGVPGLTLYHLKSHLQKYRLGKNLPTETSSDSNQEDYKDSAGELDLFREERSDPPLNPIKESLQIARAIKVQMEVQRKLHEQIEVQRHLQLRIEAQGKYLQKVLKKAQETLAGYASSSMGVEHAREELSQLVSMVSSGCLSSSLSELTEMRAASLEELDRQIQTKVSGCSLESSLTSSETSGLKEEKELKSVEGEGAYKLRYTPVVLPLLDQPQQPWISGLSNQVLGNKRGNTIDEGTSSKRVCTHEETALGLSKFRLSETFDLNRQCQGDKDFDQTGIDLNSTKIDQFNGVSLVP